jgi:hypothetical protein
LLLELAMIDGLYKVEFETPRKKAVGVVYAHDGKLHGGSSAFTYIGSYTAHGLSVSGTISSKRHTLNDDVPAVFGIDDVNIAFEGTAKNGLVICEGTADEAPSLKFKALLTRLAD